MIHWLIPALVAPFINAINDFIDKYLVSGAIKNPKVLPVYMAIVSFFVGTVLWVFSGFFSPTIFALFGVASGVTTIIAAAAYFKLMARKDVSEMIFYMGLTTPFVLIFSYLFLGETISPAQLTGFIFILFACALVLFKKEEAHLRWTKTLLLILTVDGMWALGGGVDEIRA
jgi:drug/metabolite transporter (DMT)-like permease